MSKTFASLFTGGGLADIGALQAGYELLWGVELDPAIAAVANANIPHRDTVHAASVIGFDWASVERPDHLHMSPPCQDFSVAKTSGKVGNDNDGIADACVEALKALQPSTVTLENVEGYRKAPGFQRIVDHLWGAGYWVNVDVLNSADFGVPQTRRRLILRAVKGGFPGPLPEPVKPWKGWYEAIKDLIPELPETQFANWQLKRLPKELTESIAISNNNISRDATTKIVDDPMMTVTTLMGRRTSQFPYAYLVDTSNTVPESTAKTNNEPSFAVLASAMRRPITTPTAYLVESKNANQQYGDGIRHQGEPHTTVITDHKPSHQPKVFLVDGLANDGARVTSVSGDTPSFTVSDSAGKRACRASTPAGRVVRMTPRCLARFQSVPDWYVLPNEDIQRFRKMGNDLMKGNGIALACKIIGNGVPCLMMHRVLESLR
jgi:DNA (cytosine-5)-methyltransferase 1